MINESDSEKGELDSFLERSRTSDDGRNDGHNGIQTRPRRLLCQRLLTITPWLLTVFFATLSLVLFKRGSNTYTFGSYSSGFDTDISAKPFATRTELFVMLIF